MRPPRLRQPALAAACALVLGGCVDMDAEIFVRRDASCRVTITAGIPDHTPFLILQGWQVDPHAVEELRRQAVPEARRHARRLVEPYEGARVEAVDLVGDGPRASVRTILEFPDANVVDFGRVLRPPSGDGPEEGDEGEGDAEEEPPSDGLRITCAGGVVTIARGGGEVFDAALVDKVLGEQQKAQLRALLPAVRHDVLHVSVRVDGAIAETNARHVDRARGTVRLFVLPFGEALDAALNRTAALTKAFALADPAGRARALEALVPGFEIETADPVTIRVE